MAIDVIGLTIGTRFLEVNTQYGCDVRECKVVEFSGSMKYVKLLYSPEEFEVAPSGDRSGVWRPCCNVQVEEVLDD